MPPMPGPEPEPAAVKIEDRRVDDRSGERRRMNDRRGEDRTVESDSPEDDYRDKQQAKKDLIDKIRMGMRNGMEDAVRDPFPFPQTPKMMIESNFCFFKLTKCYMQTLSYSNAVQFRIHLNL